MDKSPFSNMDDPFASIAFNENEGDNVGEDCSFSSEDDDFGVSLALNVALKREGSFPSYDDIDDQEQEQQQRRYEGDIEEQHQKRRPTFHDEDRSTSTSSVYVEPKRSSYASRRCSKVDLMTQRLMIHPDDFYKTRNKKRRRRCMFFLGLAVGALATTGATIWTLNQSHHQAQENDNVDAVVTHDGVPESSNIPDTAGTDSLPTITAPDDHPRVFENADMVKVPFANQYNLRYDGLLFVKDENIGRYSAHEHPLSYTVNQDHIFDSYAKTMDPITELHFAPGEANTTKHVVLTTTHPDLKTNSVINQNPTRDMAADPGIILSIGLESNGELWLPHSTGQNILQFELGHGQQNKHHHLSHTMMKRIYGPGDRFVLTIGDDAITLFRNDYRELVGMWQNPTSAAATTAGLRNSNPLSSSPSAAKALPMYAQIWFKDPKSSMMANAWHDESSDAKDGLH